MTHAALLKTHFNSITAENEMKFESLQRTEGNFSYDAADRMVNFAVENGMKIRSRSRSRNSGSASGSGTQPWTGPVVRSTESSPSAAPSEISGPTGSTESCQSARMPQSRAGLPRQVTNPGQVAPPPGGWPHDLGDEVDPCGWR
ncbi:endo-1,4-beta-xylanase [Sorangium sp. So ce1078]|uniref:endo-1,4-beta-xylanase n=1 Tax=Sorangium sp. So ce1078 TaxID=3133329 RepID=UPI003F60B921